MAYHALITKLIMLDPVGGVVCEPTPPGYGASPASSRPAFIELNELRPSTYRNSGSITIDWLLAVGVNSSDVLTKYVGLTALLRSRMRVQSYSAIVANRSVSASGAIAQTTSASIRDFLAVQQNGQLQYSIATATGTAPTGCPRYPVTAGNYPSVARGGTGTAIYSHFLYMPSTIADPAYGTGDSLRRTFALSIQGDGWYQQLYGVTLRSLRIAPDGEGGAVRMSGTFDAAWVQNGARTYTPDEILPAYCRPLFARGGRCGIQATGNYNNSFGLQVYNWSVQIDWSLSRAGVGGLDTDAAPPEATGCKIVVDVWLHYDALQDTWFKSTFDNLGHFWDVCLPFGGDLTAAIPYGGAIILQQCVLVDASLLTPDLSNGGRLMHLRFSPSLYTSINNYTSIGIGFF